MAATQVRLALVVEGGVSLAVWMSGVAHEVDLLRRAAGGPADTAATVTDGTDSDGPAPSPTGSVLAEWQALCEALDIEVVVDILGGTSAGGLNAALLGCSAATGAPLPDLKQLWAEAGQLERHKLLHAPGTTPLP